MLHLPSGLRSRGSNASTRRYNDSTELEVNNATQPLSDPHVSESTGKEESNCVHWNIDPDYQGEIGLPFHNVGKAEYV